MKILYLSSWWPWPTDTGGKIRILNILRQLARVHQVTFLGFSRSKPSPPLMEDENVRILPPVTMPRPPPGLGRLLPNPRWHCAEMEQSIATLCASESFDVVYAAEVLAGHYARRIPARLRVLDNCELTVFLEQSAREPDLLRRLGYKLEWWRKGSFTKRLALQHDLCTVTTEQEAKHLSRLTRRDDLTLVVPNGVDTAAHSLRRPMMRHTLVYQGALTFHANLDAMRFFIDDIFPLVRERIPDARLRITGDCAAINVEDLFGTSEESVEVTGFLPNVRPLIAESAVCVVPLRIGGGSRLKILEAMALGIPVVSTAKGAEGLHVTHEHDILIADEPKEFAGWVIKLLALPELRENLIENARQLVHAQYDWSICVAPLLQHIADTENRTSRQL